MSLTLYLTLSEPVKVLPGSGIFVRRDGQTVEISRREWDQKFPGCEPAAIQPQECESCDVYSANITHNLNRMAEEAGVYQLLWHPEQSGIVEASQMIEHLSDAVALMRRDPDRFKSFNPSNNWGSYDTFVPWLEKFVTACRNYPNAKVSAFG